jgi:cobalt-zinc-cadmium efflux system protein
MTHDHHHTHAHDHAHGDAHDHGSHDHAGHDHSHAGHSHAPALSQSNERVVLIGFAITLVFAMVEIVGGLVSGSLALVADAGHMLTDAAALGLAWAGFRFGRRPSSASKSFGYRRFEVVAGFVNALSLLVLVGWIAFEAIGRLFSPDPVLSGPMLVVAIIGLVANLGVFALLQSGDRSHVNIRGAMLHVMGDLLGSVGAIIAAISIWLTGWTPIDPILSLLLSALILRSTWVLLRGALHILMEGTPAGLDPATVRTHLLSTVPGVASVEHLHMWSITSGMVAATLEIHLAQGADPASTSRAVKTALKDRFAIGHTTVEIIWEDKAHACPLSESAEALP